MLDRDQLERWLYGAGPQQRHTQDSPIMPDVWLAYGLTEDEPGSASAAERPLVADGIRRQRGARDLPPERVDLLLRPEPDTTAAQLAAVLAERIAAVREETRLAVNESYVACRLTFAELLRAVLPLTAFWQRNLWTGRWLTVAELVEPRFGEVVAELAQERPRRQGRRAIGNDDLPGNLVWLIGLAGRIAWEERRVREYGIDDPELPTAGAVVHHGLELLGDLRLGPGEPLVAGVSRNRPVEVSVWRSRVACKADAAATVFGLSCRDVRWAVVDSGIDARHPAFTRRTADDRHVTTGTEPEAAATSRVVRTWDFSAIRETLSGGAAPAGRPEPAAPGASAPLRLDDRDEEADRVEDWVTAGRAVDWDVVAPGLEIPHDERYVPPPGDHGTHVAGILAADWRAGDEPSPGPDDVRGMCPDIAVYDLRVFRADGSSDEFSILSAM